MSGATNPMDNVASYVGLLSNPEKDRPVDPPDGTRINGRLAVDDAEEAIIKAAREQERAAGAAMVAGVGQGRLTAALN